MGDFPNAKVISANEVEAAAEAGHSELTVSGGAVVTPLARERAAALGVNLVTTTVRARTADRQTLEDKAREVSRRVIAAHGGDPGMLEDVVKTVLKRMSGDCPCGKHGSHK